jgi:acyl carrier protein
MQETIIERLTEVFRQVLRKPDLVLSRELKASDVPGWDSITHAELIANTEKAFGIKFKLKDVLKLKNVGDLIDTVAGYQTV